MANDISLPGTGSSVKTYEDGTGDHYQFVMEGGDYELAVARGLISGHTPWSKFGRNTDIDTGTAPEDVWEGGGLYTGFPTGAAETMEIASSDAADAAAGTGARTVTISGLLDGDGVAAADVTVTLNGTSQVSLGAGTYSRASRIVVDTAGSGGANAGVLTLRHTSTTANIFAGMPIGRNQTAIMAYTVPVGQTLYVRRMAAHLGRASGGAGSAQIGFLRRPFGGVFQTFRAPELTNSAPYIIDSGRVVVFEARTDILVRVEDVSDDNTMVSAEMDGALIAD